MELISGVEAELSARSYALTLQVVADADADTDTIATLMRLVLAAGLWHPGPIRFGLVAPGTPAGCGLVAHAAR